MIDTVEQASDGGAVYFALSDTGLLLYAPTGKHHQMVWVDRNGAETPVSSNRAPFRDSEYLAEWEVDRGRSER